MLGMPSSFLDSDPELWSGNDDYAEMREIVRNVMPVTNDAAERAVKLMTQYSKRFTHNEDQKQAVFQMVSYFRKKYPSVNTSMSACKTIGFLVNVGPCKPLV